MVAVRQRRPDHLVDGVGDAAEARFALGQRLLGFADFRDVDVDADHADKIAVRVEARMGVGAQRTPLAIGAPVARFNRETELFAHALGERLRQDFRVFRMHRCVPVERTHILLGNTPELALRTVEIEALAVLVPHPQHDGRAVGDEAEALFAFAQRGFGEHALGDIGGLDEDVGHGAKGVADRLIDKIDVTPLGRAGVAAIDGHFHAAADIGLARGVDLVEQLDETLRRHFRQRLRQWLAEDVAALTDEFEIRLVGDFVDVVGATQDRNGARRLPEHLAEPVDFLCVVLLRAHLRRDVKALRQQTADMPVRVVERHEAVAPPAFASSRPLDRQHLAGDVKTPTGFDHLLELRPDSVPDIGARFPRRTTHRPRVPPGLLLGPRVVVDRDEILAPVDGRGDRGIEADRQRRAQGVRPRLRPTQRGLGPVKGADEFARLPAARQKCRLRQVDPCPRPVWLAPAAEGRACGLTCETPPEFARAEALHSSSRAQGSGVQ